MERTKEPARRRSAARRVVHRQAGWTARRPPREVVSPQRELTEFLAVVYQTVPSPAALAYLRGLEPEEQDAALFEYAARLGEQGIVPPLVQQRVTALRRFVASLP
jgi:hypothetical protein